MSQLRALVFVLLILSRLGPACAQSTGLSPKSVKVKRGLTLSLSLLTPLDSARARVGDEVTAKLDRPLIADGITVLPANWIVHGTVTKVKHAGKNCHAGEIHWKLRSIPTPNGDPLRVQQVFAYPFNPNHIGDPDWVPLDTAWTKIRHGSEFVGVVVVFVALSPFMVPLAIALSGENRCHGQAGKDEVLQARKAYLYAVSKDTRVSVVP